MVSRITCQVHDGAHVTVVRLAGTLDMISMREVYAHLERCLARQPDALVVDLAELAVHDQLAVSVFAAAARHAADWPAVPLVLCAPHPERPARPGGQRDEGGRGLLLVRELADRWGSAPAGDGKAVWATLPAN